jgi:hypothetical protein
MDKIQIRDGKIQIRDLGWRNPDPESGITIPDTQHFSLNFITIRKEPYFFIFCGGVWIPQLS